MTAAGIAFIQAGSFVAGTLVLARSQRQVANVLGFTGIDTGIIGTVASTAAHSGIRFSATT